MGKVARFEDESRALTLAYAQLLEARANWQCITPSPGDPRDHAKAPTFFSCNFVKTRYNAFEHWRATEVGHRLTILARGVDRCKHSGDTCWWNYTVVTQSC